MKPEKFDTARDPASRRQPNAYDPYKGEQSAMLPQKRAREMMENNPFLVKKFT